MLRLPTPSALSKAALARLTRKNSVPRSHNSEPLAEVAYTRLRQAIHEGLFEPNTHLAEIDISKWLQMSRTPVREAMGRLINEGLLTNKPYCGTVVSAFSANDANEIYLVREMLEIPAAGLCAQNATDLEIQSMQEIIDAEALSLRDPGAMINLNRRFHQEIYKAARNQFLQKMLSSVQGAIGVLGKTNLINEKRALQAHREHRAILYAIRQHDPRAAEQAARAHVNASRIERLNRIAAHSPGRKASAKNAGGAPDRPVGLAPDSTPHAKPENRKGK